MRRFVRKLMMLDPGYRKAFFIEQKIEMLNEEAKKSIDNVRREILQCIAGVSDTLRETIKTCKNSCKDEAVDNSGTILLTRRQLAHFVWGSQQKNAEERIAVFTPLPPEQTGIANFSAKLHLADSNRYDVIARIETAKEYLDGICQYGRLYNAIPYDFYSTEIKGRSKHLARIFVIGNSMFHAFAVSEAICTKGEPGRYLYLHEALIYGALSEWLSAHNIWHKEYIREWYPEKSDLIDNLEKEEWNAFCQKNEIFGIRPLVALTGITDIIVNNSRCKELVIKDLLPETRAKVRIRQLFLPIESHENIERVSGLSKDGEIVIGSFGMPSPLKATDMIVAAVQKLNENGLRCRLLLAGWGCLDYLSTLSAESIEYCFTWPGTEVSEIFLQLMASVDVAVQLRIGQHGESSGCISEILGIGTPLVTNQGFVDPSQESLCTCTPPQPTVEDICVAIRKAIESRGVVGSARSQILESYSFENAAAILYDLVKNDQASGTYSKKILVDATMFDGHGIQRATDALYSHIRKLRPDIEVVYVCQRGKDSISRVPHRTILVDSESRVEGLLLAGRREMPDVFHFPWNGNPPDGVSELFPKTKIVSTIHDVIPLRIPEVLGWPKDAVLSCREQAKRTLELSQLVFCDSLHTINDLKYIFGVANATLKCLYFAPMIDLAEKEESCDIKEPFFLYNGGYCPRKGIELLISNFIALKKAGKLRGILVMTGHPWLWSQDLKDMYSCGQSKGWIVELGYVTDAKLLWLYRHATASVYPSLYEGFGLPPLESMSLGCPAIVARTSSLPEVCGDSVLYLENRNDENEFQDALVRIESDVALQNKLRRKGRQQAARFTWEKTVKRYINEVFGNLQADIEVDVS